MTGGLTKARLLAQVSVACGRIAGGAAALVEAHRLGIPEGPHERPWTPDYHRDAARVYAESLPASYQRGIAALFDRSVQTMAEGSIPAQLAEDWVIVMDYMRCASASIAENLTPPRSESRQHAAVSLLEVEGRNSPPMVIRFDALARLTTVDGASRLERAAIAVRQHMEAPLPAMFDGRERHLLKRLSAGAAIADLAAEMGYSERSTYRVLAGLWEKLGVTDRTEGMQKAVSEGLLD